MLNINKKFTPVKLGKIRKKRTKKKEKIIIIFSEFRIVIWEHSVNLMEIVCICNWKSKLLCYLKNSITITITSKWKYRITITITITSKSCN